MSFLTKLPRERYRSDALAKFRANPNEFNGAVRAAAWMSQLAYETDEPAKVNEIALGWGATILPGGIISEEVATVLPKASTQLIVGKCDDNVVIAFAGTDPPVLADWITDFDLGTTEAGTTRGFTVAADAVWSKIDALLQGEVGSAPIFVTGHSLGGALAVIVAKRIEDRRQGRVRAVYTFGMPRAGSPHFAASYDQALGLRTFRLVHGNDVVPTVPPSFLGFQHVGRYLHCASRAKFQQQMLAAAAGSDEPLFEKGVSKQLKELLHRPLASAMSLERWKLAGALITGRVPSGMRTDVGGVLIELLPPPVRDHWPDRYIDAAPD